ncbi:hypothetical protein GOARA_056_01070 [Gordonia araii NBRC 100433]|uniref:ATP-binding protein n=1 Tax=Gordonia araii NBRC 100433 TaxID=1073574 RepID=G7H3D4_9ACTN|nr:hypothetical protein [Gordonia araii]NNG96478.1 hypothetical protein [Gordonia araii NBRC 100433]GAB10359.1 hypothetical protein GOARA_056_01070 [Gordonia araii NBRC 100433]
MPDAPFDVDRLRAAVLDSWRGSPTRLIEDARSETDLAAVGYRDRLFTELAANAADAATDAGITGRLRVWRDDSGALHIANTGSPLSAAGAASLLALRVSPKDPDARTVGRFGVGFAAVVPVAQRVEVRSSTATLIFDRARTAEEITAAGLDAALTGEDAPLLRLAWPGDTGPAEGFDTEIVVFPRAGVDVDALLAGIADQVCDRLLELPALGEVTVDGARVTAVRDDGLVRFEPPDAVPGADRVWRAVVTGDVRWCADESGSAGTAQAPVELLRTPTPTDIELSVRARVIAALPVTPDRRHLMPGVDVGVLAPGYLELVRAVAPKRRPGFVPRALGRNPADARLLEAIAEQLREHAWVPPAHGDDDLVAGRVLVVADLSDELAACLGPVLADLAHPSVSGPAERAVLVAVGARVIGLAEIAEALAGVTRPASWWATLYEALAPSVVTSEDAQELGALPVPRGDGRVNLGARGLVFTTAGVAAPWAPTVAPEAVHPLLERLGARPVGPAELLAEPALVAALADAAEHGDDTEVRDLADAVLALLAADPDAALAPEASAELLLADHDGELVHVDELLMTDSPLAGVLGDEAPFAFVADSTVGRHGASALRRAGVGWGFLTVAEEWPTGPDHDLDDEQRWWADLAEPPPVMRAVRDLDLVPEDRWRHALTLLAEDETTAPMLADRDGYTAWWLRRHARVDGRRLGSYRSPDAESFDGIVDALDHPAAAALTGVLMSDTVRDAVAAALVVENLGDPERTVAPGAAVRAYGEVAAAIARGEADEDDVVDLFGEDPRARTLDGSVAEDAVVVDEPHFLAVVVPGRAVVPGLPVSPDAARRLAGLLDLPLASEALAARVVSEGRATTWDAEPVAIRFAGAQGIALPCGTVVVHDELVVETVDGRHRVPWWRDGPTTHLSRLP